MLTLTHKWQDQGLGVAPFRVVAILSVPSQSLAADNTDAYNGAMADCQASARAFGVTLCACQACGQSLVHNVIIRDARGAHFVVGTDCATKTDDAEVISQVEAIERKKRAEEKAARHDRERQERQARRDADEAAQRERNNGLTDFEVKAKAGAEAEAAREARYTAENAWLLDVLKTAYQGDFVVSIMDGLRRNSAADVLGGRARDIVADIYAKAKGGRRGSKKYASADQEFENRMGEQS